MGLASVRSMKRIAMPTVLIAFLVCALPYESPAPLIYTPGIGWTYERFGKEGKWTRTRAKEQLAVAQKAFEEGDFSTARKAANHTVKQWPLSDYAPEALFLEGRCLEEKGQHEKAFKHYQELVEKYPKFDKYEEVLKRQYKIANEFLDGRWFKLWGYVPLAPSMDKTVEMYQSLIEAGPFSEVAPEAQMKIGQAREKKKNFKESVKAHEKAANRYHDRPEVAAEALFGAGLAYQKQAKTSEYDQGAAGKAIDTFTDFIALYPEHEKVEEAQDLIDLLRTEQARGAFKTARYYEKRKKWRSALIYYNDVLVKDATSSYAIEAKAKIETLKLIVDELDKIDEEFSQDNADEK